MNFAYGFFLPSILEGLGEVNIGKSNYLWMKMFIALQKSLV